MTKVRGALTATAMSALLLGGLIGPTVAQTATERCGPYTGVACPVTEVPQRPTGEVVPPEQEPIRATERPVDEEILPEEDSSEVEGEGITEADPSEPEQTVDAAVDTDEAVAASDEPRFLGSVLARTGTEAWVLSLVGALWIGGGLAVLATRRHLTAQPIDQ